MFLYIHIQTGKENIETASKLSMPITVSQTFTGKRQVKKDHWFVQQEPK